MGDESAPSNHRPRQRTEKAGSRFEPYPEQRDSGIDWLGQIPRHWSAPKLGFVTEMNPSKRALRGRPQDTPVSFVPMDAVGENGGLDLASERPLGDVVDGYTYFEDGDVLVAKITPCFENGKGALAEGLRSGIGFGTTELHVLRPREELDARFLFYVTISGPFRRLGEAAMYGAAGQKRVPDDFISGLNLPLPTIDEQRTIAEFLDRETAKIDDLIDKKQRLFELLEEKRTALITQAVTKGLDPDAEMENSGVEWFGNIPRHWETVPLKRCWSVIDCKHRTVPFVDDGIPVASIGEVTSLEVDLSRAKRTTPSEYAQMIQGGRKPEKGDIVYSRNATVGAAAYVATEEEFCLGQDVCLIRSRDQSQRFLLHVFRSPAVLEQLEELMVGTTFRRINVGQINRLLVTLPPLSEQVAVARRCDAVHQQHEDLIAQVERALELLKEYRAALVSAAVTGKIDVREDAA